MIANGQTEGLTNFYFSIYPNNQCIVLIQSLILKLNNVIGIFDTENGLIFIILLQCVISSFAGKCLYDIIQKIINSIHLSWLGWITYVVLLGLSGWNVVAYIDMIAIAFPVMILKLYILLKEDSKSYMKWFFIISLSYWGFKIKPTVVIILIAIILSDIVLIIKDLKKANIRKIKKIAAIIGMAVISITLYSSIFSMAVSRSGLKIDKEANFGSLHMIMMGLNPVNHGVWYEEDVSLSQGISNKAERKQAQKEVIFQRLKDYGFSGLMSHLTKKSLINFNDGTFAWGCEGGFYDVVYPDKNHLASPFLKSLYYNRGSRYSFTSTVEQLFWITILFGSIGIILSIKNRESLVVLLSLVGIILFNYLFEARARYILLYVPFFIIATMISMKNAEILIGKKVKKNNEI